MNETTLDLIAGGFHRCDSSWTKPADRIDQCFKVYIPLRGRASVTLAGQTHPLRPGFVYFIPGYSLIGQSCARRMDVHWIHFIPKSLYLFFLLSHVSQIHSWPTSSMSSWGETWKQFDVYFSSRPMPLLYRIHAMLLDLIADVLKQYNFNHMAKVDPVFEQLRPAITYMDNHFLENPSLARIAVAAHLAPNYFHRRFARTFLITPHAYLLQRRMGLARQLLLGTPLTIREIAARCGYDCPFHFSRVFRKCFGLSPAPMRLQHQA